MLLIINCICCLSVECRILWATRHPSWSASVGIAKVCSSRFRSIDSMSSWQCSRLSEDFTKAYCATCWQDWRRDIQMCRAKWYDLKQFDINSRRQTSHEASLLYAALQVCKVSYTVLQRSLWIVSWLHVVAARYTWWESYYRCHAVEGWSIKFEWRSRRRINRSNRST